MNVMHHKAAMSGDYQFQYRKPDTIDGLAAGWQHIILPDFVMSESIVFDPAS
jgi:hypothetical protein